MKIRRFIPKRKLQATARRMPQRAMEGFDGEPNMSFAKALIVVLVLHVVAVSGIWAFNSIKAHKMAMADANGRAVAEAEDTPTAKRDPQDAKQVVQDAKHDAQEAKPAPVKAVAQPAAEVAKAAETAHKKPADDAAKTQAPLKDSGSVYTVAKGDNPVIIARKLHVSYDELLKLNKIEDPKKLQIGQKLRIPAKSKSS